MLGADSLYQLGPDGRLATGPPCGSTIAVRLRSPLGEVALELGHGDQAPAPFGLDGDDDRDDPPVESRQADAEGLGRLLAR
jgi:hypothetical protein